MKALALLLLCLAAIAQAQNCSSLNAVVDVHYEGHYKQYIQDSRPLSDVKTLFVQHAFNVDFGNMNINEQTSFLGRAILKVPNQEVFNGRTTELALDGKLSKTFLQPSDAAPKTVDQQSVLFGLSNIIGVKDLYTGDRKDASIAIVTTLVPTATEKVDSINFAVIDGDDSYSNVNYTFGAISFQASDKDEPIYDVNGAVVENQDKKDILAAAVNYTSIDFESISHQKIVASRLLTATKKDVNSVDVDIVALVNTQDSIKLVRYEATATRTMDRAPVITVNKTPFHIVLVPRVKTVPSNGAIIQVFGDQIFVAAALSKDQKAAFKTVHGIDLEFTDSQKRSPFLLKINSADGKVLSATNLAISSVPHSIADDGFPADFDIKDGAVLAVSNTIDIPTYTTRAADASLQSFITRVTFDAAGTPTKTVQSLIKLIDERARKGKSKEDIENIRFVAYSVAFALDGNADRALIGGSVGSYKEFYSTGGRLVLTSFNADPKGDAVSGYDLEVGYSGSNAVRIIRRAATSNGEFAQIANFLGGPTSAPPANPVDDKFRGVKCGFWLVDCSPPDAKLQQIFTILFYVIFGVVCFAMTTAIIGFTIKGVYEHRKGKKEADERRSLLM
jgi:hypothetical protein